MSMLLITRTLSFDILWLVLLVTTLPAWGIERHVANEGTDNSGCGAVERPCRSISQAITNATEGDVILVGPGRYGDLNRDGDFVDPGEESAEVGFGCYCMLNIAKRLTIVSRAGAEMTVLDARDRIQRVVFIQADGVTFGGSDKGFTLTGAFGPGVAIVESMTGVRIEGNLIRKNRGSGILVRGNQHVLVDNTVSDNRKHGLDIARGGGHEIRHNVIRDNFAGGIHTLVNDLHIADNTFVGNDPVRGCGLINNSRAELALPPNMWGLAKKQDDGSVNKVCNLGGSLTTDLPLVQH